MGEVVIDFKRWCSEHLWTCTDSELLNLNEDRLIDAFLEDLRAEFKKRNTIQETIGLIRQEQEA